MKTHRSIPGVDDGKEFAKLKESMSKVDIGAKDQVRYISCVFYILSKHARGFLGETRFARFTRRATKELNVLGGH